jgi:RpiB/LacA/LacB family sugar-phosphate isomerase
MPNIKRRIIMQDIIIGSDHRGFELKQRVKEYLKSQKYFVVDVGCTDTKDVDYPTIVKEVVERVKGAGHFAGILICGSGVGISMAANRYKGIRAALCHTVESAKMARQHHDFNVLCLSGNREQSIASGAPDDPDNAIKIVRAFLNTKFLGDAKYRRRNEMLDGN